MIFIENRCLAVQLEAKGQKGLAKNNFQLFTNLFPAGNPFHKVSTTKCRPQRDPSSN